MGLRSTQFRTRGPFSGEDVSGKSNDAWHVNQIGYKVSTPGIIATGGHVQDWTAPDGTKYRTHMYTGSGTFVVTGLGKWGNALEYLVVGGGGGSPGWNSGGGGGGGVRTNVPGTVTKDSMPTTLVPGGSVSIAGASMTATIGTYTVTIGAGGANNGGTSPGQGGPGGQTEFYPTASPGYPNAEWIRAPGGGGAGGANQPTSGSFPGLDGAGGGGGGWSDNTSTPGGDGNPSPQQDPNHPARLGYPGAGDGGYGQSGGGGGAGEAGYPYPYTNPLPNPTANDMRGKGGDGVFSTIIISPPTYDSGTGYCWGGAGGGDIRTSPDGGPDARRGGKGGGGRGGNAGGITPLAGGPGYNDGGNSSPGGTIRGGHGGALTGGGGGGTASPNPAGANGGSGTVIIRYKVDPDGNQPYGNNPGPSISKANPGRVA